MCALCNITNRRFYVFSQAAEETKASSSFNPFLVEDSEPPLLLDIDSSDPNPIQHVLSYFQKDSDFSAANAQNSGQQNASEKAAPNFESDSAKNKSNLVWLFLSFSLTSHDNNHRHTIDNKIPCVFTATDGLPVVSHIIDGYKQMAGEFKCVVVRVGVWKCIRCNEMRVFLIFLLLDVV